MSKRFRTCDLNQPYLLPPSLQDWLPEKHLARFVHDVVSELDLSAIYADYERRDGRGLAAYHPLLLTRVLLYCYAVGMTSSRRIEKATYEDLAVRYLAADQHPDHDTLAHFRQRHLTRLGELFVQALRLCQRAGLVKLGNVALDGTKLQANASLHRSFTPARLSQQERELEELVQRMLAGANRTDEVEDREYGKGKCGDEMPAELADAVTRLERIRQAQRELAQEAAEELARLEQQRPPSRPGRPAKGQQPRLSVEERGKLKKRLQRARQKVQHPTRQYNFTDPQSRVMRDNGKKCFVHGYNVQAAVDGHAPVIVAADVTQQLVDNDQLLPMCEQMRKTLGELPQVITADAGYWDTTNLRLANWAGTQVLVSPDATHSQAKPLDCKSSAAVQRMRELLKTPIAGALYRARKAIVEPVFGQIKHVRGLRQFTTRGLAKVRAE
jgi:transposase